LKITINLTTFDEELTSDLLGGELYSMTIEDII